MACSINLFDYLNGSPQINGSWHPGQPNGGDCSDIVNANPSGLIPSAGYLGALNADGATAGTYYYTYLLPAAGGTCQDCAVVTVTINNGVVTNLVDTYCNDATLVCSRTFCTADSTDYNLYNVFLAGTPTPTSTTGTWSQPVGQSLTSPAYNPGTASATDDTFRPSSAGVGTYQFIYTLNNGAGVSGGDAAPAGCDNCYAVITITLTVQATPDAGSDGAVTLCN